MKRVVRDTGWKELQRRSGTKINKQGKGAVDTESPNWEICTELFSF